MRYALPQQLMRAGLPKGGSYQTAELQPRGMTVKIANQLSKILRIIVHPL
jgi:hypothetical protein